MLEITKKKKEYSHHHPHTPPKGQTLNKEWIFLIFFFANGNKNIALQLGLQSLYLPGMGWTQALVSPGGTGKEEELETTGLCVLCCSDLATSARSGSITIPVSGIT